jgi:hypothetical protein
MIDFLIGFGIVIAFLLIIKFGGLDKVYKNDSSIKLEKKDLDGVSSDNKNNQSTQLK